MFEQAFKNLNDVLRQEAGCTTELDYTEQTSGLLFLKYLNDLEHERSTEAVLTGTAYDYLISDEFRWYSWAAPKTNEAIPKAGPASYYFALCGNDPA